MRKLQIITFLGLVLLCNRCSKSDDNPVPIRTVDIYVYLSNPDKVNLNAVGGSVNIDGGVRGIAVYRRSNDEFVALDRNCTYQSDKSCAIVDFDKPSGATLLICNCCGSRFKIYDGSVDKGPATAPLRHYTTEYNSSNNTVHIYN